MRKLFSFVFPPADRQNPTPYLWGATWLVVMLACAVCCLVYHNGDLAYAFLVVAAFALANMLPTLRDRKRQRSEEAHTLPSINECHRGFR